MIGWIADFPEPAGFLRALVSCAANPDVDPGGWNLSRFCDRGLDAAIDRAQAAGRSDGAAWQRIERRIAARAPVVPRISRRQLVLTSARTGNVQFHPTDGVLLDQVWVR
jgi:ABC-type oligopeptide transport system substrate-binding subunit